jgi:iron-sulfur cluster assembly protein
MAATDVDVKLLEDPQTHVVHLTPEAQRRARKFLAGEEPGKVFRVGVNSGGCSGFSFKVEIDERRPGDLLQRYEGEDGVLEVVVDPKCVPLIGGTKVDYKDTIGEAGFAFDNPQAEGTCGCGVSFDV